MPHPDSAILSVFNFVSLATYRLNLKVFFFFFFFFWGGGGGGEWTCVAWGANVGLVSASK